MEKKNLRKARMRDSKEKGYTQRIRDGTVKATAHASLPFPFRVLVFFYQIEGRINNQKKENKIRII
jgi:hypothetical protein